MIGDPLIRIVSGGIVGDEVDPSRFDVDEIVGRGGREIGDVEDVDASVIDDGKSRASRSDISAMTRKTSGLSTSFSLTI